MAPLFHLILQNLTKKQQELLIYAAQECISQFVEYQPGRYIGVDAKYNSKLIIEQEEGLWSIGRIKQ